MKKIKRILLLVISLILCLSLSIQPIAAVQITRSMPVPFEMTHEKLKLYPQVGDFPPGVARFDVTISGTFDVQRDYATVSSTSCFYRGGINCTEHDVEVVTWTSSSDPKVIYWKLQGTLAYQWTSPVTGMQYESVNTQSETMSFNAQDYILS